MKNKNLLKIELFIFAYFIGSVFLFGQNQKEIFESCETNNDCKSGYCVTLGTGEKKCADCDQSELDYLT